MAEKPLRVGVIGLGFMGRMHLGAYRQLSGVKVVAISDHNAKRAAGDLSDGWGNLPGAVDHWDMKGVKGTTDWREVLDLLEVDVVDVCLPTPTHAEVSIAALKAGKHVICEKPMARSVAEARAIEQAERASRKFFMPAMVLRFVPEYAWLKKQIETGELGALQSLVMRRVCGTPKGWFLDAQLSGGAILDLHLHDADFIAYLLGMPRAVQSHGIRGASGAIDHVVSHYFYEPGPGLVVAEGGWLSPGVPFSASYTACFEKGTAQYQTGIQPGLTLTQDEKTRPVEVSGDGFQGELAYFLECIRENRPPRVSSSRSGLAGLKLVEAEIASCASGKEQRLE